jgi:predicted Zn-dependent protease
MQLVIQEQASSIEEAEGGTAEKRNKADGSAYVTALRSFTSGKVHEAKALVQLMLARNPKDAEALHLLALILYELGDLKGAAARLRASVEADPSALEAWSDLGAILRDQGKYDEAFTASLTHFARSKTLPGLRKSRPYLQGARQAGGKRGLLSAGRRDRAGLCAGALRSRAGPS